MTAVLFVVVDYFYLLKKNYFEFDLIVLKVVFRSATQELSDAPLPQRCQMLSYPRAVRCSVTPELSDARLPKSCQMLSL